MSKKVMTSKEAWDWICGGLYWTCDSDRQIAEIIKMALKDVEEGEKAFEEYNIEIVKEEVA